MTRAAAALLALLLVAVPAAWFVAGAPHFGGYDSYFFFLYADDLAKSASTTSFARYSYFPGSYAFWRVAAATFGRNYAAFQYVFAGVAFVNAALTGLIVRVTGGARLLAAGAFGGYLIFGRRLELWVMTTEPLATLAALFGVLVWLVCLRKGRERLGLIALGVGYGLAVFTKQQGAFVAAGAVGLVPSLWGGARSWSRALADGAIVVAAALATFAAAMTLDGGGIAAVKLGLATAVGYESRGGLPAHLVGLALWSPALFAGLAAATILWIPAFLRGRERPGENRRALLGVWALGVATAIVTLLQYTKRGYAHYALLTLPFALIAIASAATWSWERFRASLDPKRLAVATGAAVVAVAALLGAEAWALPAQPALPPPLHEKYLSMCEGIEPGKRLLLLPSRENALHWACGTNARGTRWGYTFNFQERPDEYVEELSKPDLTQVFVFSANASHPYEMEIARRQDWTSFFAALEKYGFRSAGRRDAGILYRRTEKTDGRP